MTLKKYDEIMERIKVTPEMRERVLEGIDAEMEKQEKERKTVVNLRKRSFRSAWKYMTAACLVIAAATVWTVSRPYLPGQNGVPGQSGVPGETESVQMPNPLEEVASAKELSDLVGFEVKDLEALPFAVQQVSYISISREVAEIIYTGADQELIYRKSAGNEDNSGNYVVYGEETKRTVAGREVTVKGDDGRCGLAIWTDGTYSYSIQMREGESVSYEELDAMIENMQ